MIALADRVKETTTTTGTGTLDLAGAATGFQGFVAGAGDGEEVYYAIVGQAGGGAEGEWETGIGTVTDAATDTLSRDTVLANSNGDQNAVNFSAGTKDVFITAPASLLGSMPRVISSHSPSDVANIDIALPAGFTLFRLEGWLRPATDNQAPHLLTKRSGEASFDTGASDYTRARETYEWGDTHSVASQNDSKLLVVNGGVGNGAVEYAGFELRIFRALDAVPTRIMSHTVMVGEDQRHGFDSGVHNFSAAISELRIQFASGNIAAGEVRLTGIK